MNEWTEFVLAGGLYTILLIISNVKGSNKIATAKNLFTVALGDNSKSTQESLDKLLIRLEKVELENTYYRSKRKSDLTNRLEITNDELERQAILDELSTMAKFNQ